MGGRVEAHRRQPARADAVAEALAAADAPSEPTDVVERRVSRSAIALAAGRCRRRLCAAIREEGLHRRVLRQPGGERIAHADQIGGEHLEPPEEALPLEEPRHVPADRQMRTPQALRLAAPFRESLRMSKRHTRHVAGRAARERFHHVRHACEQIELAGRRVEDRAHWDLLTDQPMPRLARRELHRLRQRAALWIARVLRRRRQENKLAALAHGHCKHAHRLVEVLAHAVAIHPRE